MSSTISENKLEYYAKTSLERPLRIQFPDERYPVMNRWRNISIPRLGIPRLLPGEECDITRGKSRYPLLRGIIRPASFSALCF
jgi:hypothetical protein